MDTLPSSSLLSINRRYSNSTAHHTFHWLFFLKPPAPLYTFIAFPNHEGVHTRAPP